MATSCLQHEFLGLQCEKKFFIRQCSTRILTRNSVVYSRYEGRSWVRRGSPNHFSKNSPAGFAPENCSERIIVSAASSTDGSDNDFSDYVVKHRDQLFSIFDDEQFKEEVEGLFMNVSKFGSDMKNLHAILMKHENIATASKVVFKELFSLLSKYPDDSVDHYVENTNESSFARILAAALNTKQDFPTYWLRQQLVTSPKIPSEGYVQFPVYIRTNRTHSQVLNPLTNETDANFLSGRSMEGHWAVTKFSVPNFANLGSQDNSTWVHDDASDRGDAKPDHIVPLSTSIISGNDLSELLNGKECTIFVHGYNYSLANAALRMAQVVYAGNFQGPSFVFSWPSNDGTMEYAVDEANAMWAVTEFVKTVEYLREDLGMERINIVAHSMGSRVVAYTLLRIKHTDMFGEIVLVAPDFDMGEFACIVDDLKAKCKRITLYASSNDTALLASTVLHGYPRLGLFGGFGVDQLSDLSDSVDPDSWLHRVNETMLKMNKLANETPAMIEAKKEILSKIDVIDCTDFEDGFFHHEFAFNKKGVIADCSLALRGFCTSDIERGTLKKVADFNYFTFDLEKYPSLNEDTETRIP